LATAPTPGVSRRADAAETVQRIVTITLAWTGETHRLALNNVPLDHRMAVRKQTGMAFNAYTGGPDSIDVDSIAVLVWVSKRMNGQPALSWAQFARSWPTEIAPGSIDVWVEDPSGRKVDEDNNPIIDEADALDVAEVGEVGDHVPVDEMVEVEESDDPQS
jgi:hypothetical protein